MSGFVLLKGRLVRASSYGTVEVTEQLSASQSTLITEALQPLLSMNQLDIVSGNFHSDQASLGANRHIDFQVKQPPSSSHHLAYETAA